MIKLDHAFETIQHFHVKPFMAGCNMEIHTVLFSQLTLNICRSRHGHLRNNKHVKMKKLTTLQNFQDHSKIGPERMALIKILLG